MKKNLPFLSFFLGVFLFVAQQVIATPSVAITATSVSSDSFSAHFEPNAECAQFYYVTLTDEDINLWTAMMGMTLDQIIPMWGINATSACDYTWTDMAPNTTYKIFALPLDAQSNPFSYSYIEVTTDAIGGVGTSSISISVSDITSSSAMIVCTPNDQTALFYDGLITVEYFNEVGRDSACTILLENMPTPYYSTDAWTWTNLLAATDYYVIAFGQNSEGVWGDTSFVPFRTLDPDAITTITKPSISIYPIPNNGSFTISGDGLEGGVAQVYSITGQLLKTVALQGDQTFVSTNLTAGSYFVRVLNHAGTVLSNRAILIR